jgi:hypothetical protein
VARGNFASEDDLVAEAVRVYLRQQSKDRVEEPVVMPGKPIWERIIERFTAVPTQEWDKVPVDGAEQHDHYIYGTPKRHDAP